MLAKLRTQEIERPNEHSLRLEEIKQRLEDVQICKANGKKCVKAKTSKAELEEDSGYVDLSAISVSSHSETET